LLSNGQANELSIDLTAESLWTLPLPLSIGETLTTYSLSL
jgi:hypothetical protein